MPTAEQRRLKTANNGSNGNSNQPTATTGATHPNKHIEAIAEKTSQDFVEVAAAVTRAKITEKLQNGTFTSLVFGLPECDANFTYALPCGSTVNVLSGTTEA